MCPDTGVTHVPGSDPSLRVCAPRQTTCVELMMQMGRTRAFVAWAVDDGALPPDEGPLRIVVTSDL